MGEEEEFLYKVNVSLPEQIEITSGMHNFDDELSIPCVAITAYFKDTGPVTLVIPSVHAPDIGQALVDAAEGSMED